ncbi:hypothetical protein AZL_a05100 (plasmid) [Azospirillum sp. B510]|uniref:type VI secretion system membrane subunit TssM n=1 Tax=Azospirillum sp. (strain B510) TaxID=137722 RepID=UPI0001C4BC73|nr:type VI secretion system membrane subunit TssM [Azospirillum sp. B510]BAI74041.1 hypothetical protein AZL_a05100 [Azospirillum sp. B510]
MIYFYEFFTRYIGWRWLVRILVIVLLVGAYWFLAPLLEIDGAHPLAEPWARIGLPLGLVALYLVIRLYPSARLSWEKRQLARRGITATDSMNSMAVLERLAVMERFEAVAEALGPQAQPGATSADAYTTPWYLMLGPQGGGRTTLLGRAELDFPLHQPAAGGDDQPCDIWVSRNAVVVDAAGRLALQDSAPEQDEAGWRTLLQMLTRQRPRRPVNAVLLAVPVDALLADDGRRRQLAETLRRRVQEASSQFGIRMPVYLIITRCDLVAGFSEFFETRDVDEREQIWGFSLPLERTAAGEAVIRRIETEAALLSERIDAQVPPRLQHERDAARRRLIANFAVQFRLAQQALARFAAEFLRGDHAGAAPPLRGVFLTSATREGFDPALLFGLVAEPFTLDPARVPAPLHPERSFFMANLFAGAILPEANLAGTNRAVEAGLASRHMLQYGAAGLILAVAGGLWAQAYERHMGRLDLLDGAVQKVALALGQARNQPDLTVVFAPLADLQTASTGYRTAGALPTLFDLGMTPDAAIARDLDTIQSALLRREFQPRAAELARQSLAAALSANDQRAVHHALRVYLMLCTPARADAALLRGWAAQIGQAKFALFPEQNQIFQHHMADLLEVGLDPLAPEEVTVGQARRMLLRSTPAAQVYEELKRVAGTAGLRDFRLPPATLPPSGAAAAGVVSMGSDVLETATVIPGFYTSEGFYQVFLKQLPNLSNGSVEDDWMFDASSIMAVSATNADLINQVTDLYVRDYVGAWQKLLKSIEFYGFMSLTEATQTLDYLSAADSPIRNILVSLRNNVDLPVPAPPQPAAGAATAPPVRRAGLTDRLLNAGSTLAAAQLQPEPAAAPPAPPPLPPQLTGANWPGARIAAPFRSLTDLVVENGSRTAGIEGVLGVVSSLAATAKSVVLSSDPPRAAYQMALARLGVRPGQQADAITLVRMAADRQPEPVRQWLTRLAGETWAAVMNEARASVAQSWEQEVMPEWRRSMRDRYPLFREGGAEIPLKDFSTFFGPTGIIDKFVQDRLAAFIDMSGARWTNRQVDGESIELSPAALRQLQQAAVIRQAFFAQGSGTAPSVRFSLRPTMLDSRATQLQLVSGGETITYRHEPPRARKLQWPGEAGFGPLRISVTDVENRSWSLEKDGIWSLYRLLDEARIRPAASGDRYQMDLTLNGLTASFELIAETAGPNPLDPRLLRDLRLPEHLQ